MTESTSIGIAASDGRTRFPLASFEPVLLLACVVAYEAAFLSGRSFPVSARTVLVLLAPLLVIYRLPPRWNADRFASIASSAMLATVAWSLVQLTWATPFVEIGLGRCAVMAAGLVLCWSVVHGPATAESLIVSTGVGATLTLAVAIVGMVAFDFPSYGLGNINHLLYCCTPACFGWMAWLLASAAHRRRVPAWQWLAAAVAMVELVYASLFAVPGMPRRGVIVAGMLVLATSAAMWTWRTNRRAFLLATLVVLAAGAVLAWKTFHRQEGLAMARTERVLMYRAALETIPQTLPWGAGLHGPLKEQDMDGETLRHQTATGLWMSDAHNHLLQSFLDGGIVGGSLFIALLVAMVWRTLLIEDAALRAAASAIGVVLLLHAMTDNCYGMPTGMAWAGVLFGVMLKCPARVPRGRATGIPGLRAAAWVLVAFCAYGSTRELSGLFMSPEASDSVRLRTLRQTWQVDLLSDQWRAGVEGGYLRGNMPLCLAYLDLVGPRLAWTGGLLSSRCLVDARVSEFAAARFVAALKGLPSGRTGAAELAGSWRGLVAASAADTDQVQGLLRWIHRFPMGNFGYSNLGVLLARRPDLESRVPETVKRRIEYRLGIPGLPLPTFTRPSSIEPASDLYAMMVWADLKGYGPDRLAEPMRWLLRAYGDVSEVYLLAMMLARDAEPGSYAWLVDEPIINRGFEPIFAIDYLSLLASVREPRQAAGVWPVMRCVNPRMAASFETGKLDAGAADEGTPHAIWEESLRIWRLARAARAAEPAR